MHSQPCIFQFFLFIADFPRSALAGRKLGADDAEGDQLQRNGHSQQDQRGEKAGAGAEDDLAQAGDDVADRRDGGHGDGIGQLGGHMVHMAAMGAAEAMMEVSEMGEQWSPQTAPDRHAAMEMTSISPCGKAWQTMGIRMEKVPHEVPVAKARKTATRKMMAGSRYCRAAAEPFSRFAT